MGTQCQTEKKFCMKFPKAPANSRRSSNRTMTSFTCMTGYKFADPAITTFNFECRDGEWVSTHTKYATVLDCKPTCTPECLNAGTCLSYNVCQCPKTFRGPICQYPIENCSPKKLNFNGGYNCSGTSTEVSCRLYCPKGINFDFEPAAVYTCSYATAEFLPKNVPKCLLRKFLIIFRNESNLNFLSPT